MALKESMLSFYVLEDKFKVICLLLPLESLLPGNGSTLVGSLDSTFLSPCLDWPSCCTSYATAALVKQAAEVPTAPLPQEFISHESGAAS